MCAHMTVLLLKAGLHVVAFDSHRAAVDRAVSKGAVHADSVGAFVASLTVPRVIWLMLPAGDAVEETLHQFAGLLASDDTVVDGGNSNYHDTIRRSELLRSLGITFIDVGTSGGVWGLTEGYSLMIGGDTAGVGRLRPLFEALAPARDRGWAHVGPSGAGHFVKMVHNGIEYGLMQAYAEGFAVLDQKKEFALNLPQIAEVWRNGSVIRSWLLDLTAQALSENPTLEGIPPRVADSGEGRWMVSEAITSGVPCPVITLSLLERMRSRIADSFANRLLAVLRNKFGGHRLL